jgi:glycosyltransferase
VALQTHADLEHIVIDGASTDNTLDVVRQRGRHVARVLSEPDRGIYDAMNKGLAMVTGAVVGFLNADDMLATPDAVAAIASAAADPLVSAAFGDLVYVRHDRPDQVVRHWRCGPFSPSRLRYGWMPPHPTFYVRRSLLPKVGGFDTSLRIAADYDFMLRCLRLPGIRTAYVPQVLVRMRMGGASNRSLLAILRKSSEDLETLKRNQVGGLLTLACKNLRKLPQFLGGP